MKPRRKRIDPNTIVLLKHIGMGVLVLSGMAVLITAIWYGTRVQALTITEVKVEGGETIQHSKVEEKVRSRLEGTYLGLVPRQFAWLYPETDIRTSLESIDRIHDISVSRISGTELKVTFDEYVPRALWCMSATSEDCLFVDANGFAFAQAPNLSGGSFLRFIQTSQPAVLRESVTSSGSFNHLLLMAELLSERNWFINSIEVDQAGDAFLQVVGGGELKVTLSQTPEETTENLFVILGSVEFEHVKPGNFKYVDLRYGNKVFVNEEITAPEEETAIESASSTPVLEEVE